MDPYESEASPQEIAAWYEAEAIYEESLNIEQ